LHFLSAPSCPTRAPASAQAIENAELIFFIGVSLDGNPVAMSSMLIMSIIPIDIVAEMLYT
jgi:hypothetical protein